MNEKVYERTIPPVDDKTNLICAHCTTIFAVNLEEVRKARESDGHTHLAAHHTVVFCPCCGKESMAYH